MAGEDIVGFEARLARFLTALRVERGVSQEWLAQQLCRDQPFVSKVEHGQRRVTVRDLLDWLNALGVPLSAVADEIEGLRGR